MESDQLFDCTVKRRQLMGQTVYKSDVGYRSILLYLFQLNYKSAFVMSNTFQRTFQHLVDANTVLQSVIPPLPPLQRAPTQASSSLPAPALSPPSTTDQEIKIIQGRAYSSKNLLHAGHCYSKDGKLLTDVRQSWRCAKKALPCPGRLYTIHETFHCLGRSHNHPPDAADSNAKQAIDKVKQMASTSQTTNHCAVTGTLPPATGRAARYPPASWNQTDRVETDLNRTNKYCESFNKTFSSVVGHAHPTIYNLCAVHLEQASTEGKMHSYRRGVQPPKRKRRYLEKDTRLKHIVSTYHTYENNVAVYLDLLAQL